MAEHQSSASNESIIRVYETAMYDQWGNPPQILWEQEKILMQTYCPDLTGYPE